MRIGQRLGQLEDAGHVTSSVVVPDAQAVVVEAASADQEEMLLAVNGEMGSSLIAYLRLVRLLLSLSALHSALMPSAV